MKKLLNLTTLLASLLASTATYAIDFTDKAITCDKDGIRSRK